MNYKIALFSDIHLEHSNFHPHSLDADVVVVAGDLQAGPKPEYGVYFLQQAFPDKPVIYVPGNHEFECTRIVEALERMKEAAQGSLVQVLHNETYDFGGVRFLGTPLYSGFRSLGEGEERQKLMERCKVISDFSNTVVRKGEPWTPWVMSDWHDEACAWLSGELEECLLEDIPSVVVTHWAPSLQSMDPRFNDEFSGYWLNPCEGLVQRAHLWLHGHIHSSAEYHLGVDPHKGWVYCNPRGYSKLMDLSPNPHFKNPKIIQVPGWKIKPNLKPNF